MGKILFDSAPNIRDLGGYITDVHSSLKCWRVLRGELPNNLLEHEIRILLEKEVTTIIDLRSVEEVNKKPCQLANRNDFQYININLYGDGGIPKNEDEIPFIYFEMSQEYGAIKNIIKTIAVAEAGVLCHCAVGKDTTGVVVALLLATVGVSLHDIYQDYTISYQRIKVRVEEMKQKTPALPEFIGKSKVEYIKQFFDIFYERYASINDYFGCIGLDEKYIKKIRSKLND